MSVRAFVVGGVAAAVFGWLTRRLRKSSSTSRFPHDHYDRLLTKDLAGIAGFDGWYNVKADIRQSRLSGDMSLLIFEVEAQHMPSGSTGKAKFEMLLTPAAKFEKT